MISTRCNAYRDAILIAGAVARACWCLYADKPGDPPPTDRLWKCGRQSVVGAICSSAWHIGHDNTVRPAHTLAGLGLSQKNFNNQQQCHRADDLRQHTEGLHIQRSSDLRQFEDRDCRAGLDPGFEECPIRSTHIGKAIGVQGNDVPVAGYRSLLIFRLRKRPSTGPVGMREIGN